jgi:hypothetical protein
MSEQEQLKGGTEGLKFQNIKNLVKDENIFIKKQ